MVQCPACHFVFATEDQQQHFDRIEQATAAPGELRTVTRPPAKVPVIEGLEGGMSGHYYPNPEDHGPNAGDDEEGNG